MRRMKAFTFIELLMVMVVISILASLITTGAFRAIRSARESRARSDLAALETALERYRLDVGAYPGHTAAGNNFVLWLETGGTPPSDGWGGPYMRFKSDETSGNAFLDPWGNAYAYYHDPAIGRGRVHNYGSSQTQNAFDIWSYGNDGENSVVSPNFINTEDDITNWD